MSAKNQSGENAQLSLLDIFGHAGDIEGNYSSEEIEKVIGKLRAAKRTAEKQEEKERRRREKEEAERKAREEKREKRPMCAKSPAWIFLWTGATYSIPICERRASTRKASRMR